MNTTGSSGEGTAIRMASALFEIESGEPRRGSRTVLWCVCALFAILLIWSLFAKLDIVAVAHGRLVPQTYVKIVQPADAGIVREILVVEGDRCGQGNRWCGLIPRSMMRTALPSTASLNYNVSS